MRDLIQQGYEGDELLQVYEESYKKIVAFDAKVVHAHRQAQNGEVGNLSELMDSVKQSYDL